MRAAIYCRISRDKKVDGSHTMLGVERQEEDCRDLCRTLGWEVVEVYVDNDVSATSGRVRPAYRRMLQAVEAEAIDAIVCWHPDRLYRRTTDLEELVKVCDRYRVPISTVNAGAVDLTTPTGRLVAGLLAQVARYEGEHKAERWKRSYRQKREAGLPVASGSRLFGFTREGDAVPEEADAIVQTAQHLLSGGSLLAACDALNAVGITTTAGNRWEPTALKNLMTNERLAGWVLFKGERVTRGDVAILDDDTVAALRAQLLGRRRRRPPRVATLLDVMVCGECGARMVTGRRSGTRARVYRCPPARKGGRMCTSVLAEPAEAVVEGYAEARLADPRVREELARSRESGAGAKLANEVAALEARLVSLNDALVNGGDEPVPEVVRAIETVRARLTQAQEELAGVAVVAPPPDLGWPTDVAQRAALVALVVDNVTVARSPGNNGRARFDPNRLHITPMGGLVKSRR